ncbi:hypothetical protein D3C72_1439270 [compost metagenome]
MTSYQIVMGKFLAALGAVAGLVLIGFLYPAATSVIAKINWQPLIVAYFGIFLVGTVYTAMNLFCSSLTEQGIVAYVSSVVLNVSIWFIGIGSEVVDSEAGRKFFEHISFSSHLSGLGEGTIRTGGVIFFLSLVGLFIFLTERVVESARWR